MLVVGDLFGGDHDAAGHDIGVDHVDAEHGGPGIFSVRIMAAFLTAFGVGGVVGRYYDLSHPASSGVGVLFGFVMATVVYQFAKLLHSQQASSEIKMSSLVGQTAEVSVGDSRGRCRPSDAHRGGERSEHLARAAGAEALPRGTEVVITGLRGDGLVVAPPTRVTMGGH